MVFIHYVETLKGFAMLTSTAPAALSSTRWVLFAALLLVSGVLVAQTTATATTETADGQSCPTAEAGDCSCPHNKHGMGHGKSMHGYPGGPDGAGPMAMFDRMGEEVGLTEPQKQELAALMQMYRPRIKELGERGQEDRRALMVMAPNDPAYNKQADVLSKQAGASAAEMVTLLTELQANAYALLSVEQQATFLRLRAEQRQRMEQRKIEMQARREAGAPGYGPGSGHGMGKHQCKACVWLDEDDKAQALEETLETVE